MAYKLTVLVTDVPFGTAAGIARSRFDARTDTLLIEIDMSRMSDNSQFGPLVAHEVAHHVHGLHPAIDNAAGDLFPVSPVPGNLLPPGTGLVRDPLTGKRTVVESQGPFTVPRSLNHITSRKLPETVATPEDRALYEKIADAAQGSRATGTPVPDDDRVIDGQPNMPLPVLREYDVMLRRPQYEFASMTIEAASAQEAVALVRDLTKTSNLSLHWETDDRRNQPDWVNAEGEDETGAVDHHEWDAEKEDDDGIAADRASMARALLAICAIGLDANSSPEYVAGVLARVKKIASDALNAKLAGE